MRHVLTTALLLLLVPATATAQDSFCAQATACTTSVSSTSATTIVGIGVTMLTRIRKRKIAALGRYVSMNAVAVVAAVGRGGGDILYDLADMAGVREEKFHDFVARLRMRREELSNAFAGTAEPRYLGALVLAAAEVREE